MAIKNPFAEVTVEQFKEWLKETGRISERNKEIAELAIIKNMTNKEIGEIYGISSDRVSIISRGAIVRCKRHYDALNKLQNDYYRQVPINEVKKISYDIFMPLRDYFGRYITVGELEELLKEPEKLKSIVPKLTKRSLETLPQKIKDYEEVYYKKIGL